jgi:hypothetical protein
MPQQAALQVGQPGDLLVTGRFGWFRGLDADPYAVAGPQHAREAQGLSGGHPGVFYPEACASLNRVNQVFRSAGPFALSGALGRVKSHSSNSG